ncbi:hypothetical protein [Niallia sp. 01092]|uniref:hypothetical protein n=1 Tax=unclassified Niallia TaxID=2837522 RepID=UPI003FD6102E
MKLKTQLFNLIEAYYQKEYYLYLGKIRSVAFFLMASSLITWYSASQKSAFLLMEGFLLLRLTILPIVIPFLLLSEHRKADHTLIDFLKIDKINILYFVPFIISSFEIMVGSMFFLLNFIVLSFKVHLSGSMLLVAWIFILVNILFVVTLMEYINTYKKLCVYPMILIVPILTLFLTHMNITVTNTIMFFLFLAVYLLFSFRIHNYERERK